MSMPSFPFLSQTDAKALGVHSMWGFSPASDVSAAVSSIDSDRPLRVLMAQPSDIRHLLATISRRRRHGHPGGVHLFVCERQIEVLARHLLLLQVACDWELPIRQRATVFLEIFGNTLVQERTERYIAAMGQELVELVCDSRGSLADFVDLSSLKYRDRDLLVDAFKSWDARVPYDAVGLRDHRLRAHFGLRYDNRQGVVDWDYQARVRPAASIIHSKLYREWRMSGIAFEFGDQRYEVANRSLGSYAEGVMKAGKDKGLKKDVRGFWIDVVNSPYMSFGVEVDRSTPHAEGLFEVQSKGSAVEQHKHHAVEVAMFNLLSYLWELETGEPYAMAKEHDIYSGLGEDASDVGWSAAASAGEGINEDSRRGQALARARCIVETFASVKVTLLHGGPESVLGKAAFTGEGGFDLVHLSLAASSTLGDPLLAASVRPGGTVLVESAKYMVPLSGEQEELFESRIVEMGAGAGFARCASVEPGLAPGVFAFRPSSGK